MLGALKRLQEGNIAPVDLAQAAIGPGMAIFSGYSRVLEPDGSAMTVRTALQIINQELDAHLKESDVESDSETLFCIAWFDQYGLGPGPFGEAEVLAKAKNARVDHLARSGVVSSKGGKVLLSALSDYLPEWEPTSDVRISLWECTHHLIKRLQVGGEQAAAALVARIGPGRGEDAKNLAYRLYTICERKGWAEEALAYNEFVVAWPEVLKNAAFIMGEGPQKTLDMEEKV